MYLDTFIYLLISLSTSYLVFKIVSNNSNDTKIFHNIIVISQEFIDLVTKNIIDNLVNSFNKIATNKLNIPQNYDDDNIPDEFKCPISKSIMHDPVIISDGYTYDREYIQNYIVEKNTSPMTNEQLILPIIIPNWNLRKLISNHINKFV